MFVLIARNLGDQPAVAIFIVNNSRETMGLPARQPAGVVSRRGALHARQRRAAQLGERPSRDLIPAHLWIVAKHYTIHVT
jgi:hypothetical protein